MDLFDGYRRSLGEARPLIEAPGHIFAEADAVALQTLVAISLYFFWDAVLVEGTAQFITRLSHDEYLDIYAQEEDRFEKICGTFSKMDMKPTSR